MQRFSYFFHLLLILAGLTAHSQNFSISGTVKDGTNRETLTGATAYLKELNISEFTNEYGFFPLHAPKRKYTLIVTYAGFARVVQLIELSEQGQQQQSIQRTLQYAQHVRQQSRCTRGLYRLYSSVRHIDNTQVI